MKETFAEFTILSRLPFEMEPVLKIFEMYIFTILIKYMYLLDAATSSGILKAKQKLGVTFNSDKLGGIAFTKISKLTMCSA